MLVSLRLRIIMFVSVIFIVRSLVILAAGRLVTPNRFVRMPAPMAVRTPPEHGHQRVGQRVGQADAVDRTARTAILVACSVRRTGIRS